jgi:hypothetical protein
MIEAIEPDEPEEQSDEVVQDDEPGDEIASARFDAWRRRSAIGGIATGVALGLQEVFYPTNNQPVISAEAPGEPPDADERVRVILDPDDPTKSIVLMPKSPGPDGDAAPPSGPPNSG